MILSRSPELNLEGEWTCHVTRLDYSNCSGDGGPQPAAVVRNVPGSKSWQVKRDSIGIFEYPCQYYYSTTFKIKSDSIYFADGTSAGAKINGEFLEIAFAGDKSRPARTEFFRKDTLDHVLLEKLKHDSVSLGCLVGKMKIVNEVIPEDGPVSKITFPVNLPEHLSVENTRAAQALYRARTVLLPVNGQKRKFYVEKIEWNNYDGNYTKAVNNNWQRKTAITLRPAEWWTGEPFTVSYEQE